MAIDTFEDVISERKKSIRKALKQAIFVKLYNPSDDEVTTIWDSTNGLQIPDGFTHIGLITKSDGANWTSDTDNNEVESAGHGDPTRTDMTKDVTGLQVVAQESNMIVNSMYHGVDLSTVTADADGGVSWKKPAIPAGLVWSVLGIGADMAGDDRIYFARLLPTARVTEKDAQKWSEDEEVRYNVTLTASVEAETYGTSVVEFWGGPGFDGTDVGFQSS